VILLAAVAGLFFLPQCRIDSQAYQSALTGLNLTLGTTPNMHVKGMSDADYQKLVDAAQSIRQGADQNMPKPQDYTNPAFLGVVFLSALAAIAFISGIRTAQINSLGARVGRDLRDCAVGLVVILFIIYGISGFSSEQAVKDQNAQWEKTIAQLKTDTANNQAQIASAMGADLARAWGASAASMQDTQRASLERMIATIHKTAWFDLGFALSGTALCLAIAARFTCNAPTTLADRPMSSATTAGQLSEHSASADTSTHAGGTWDSIKTRTIQFVETAEAKAAEAVEAGKVEVRLHYEKSAVSACKKQLDQLALECGAAAADVSVFSDSTLQALRQKALDARQRMKESQSQHDAAVEELGRIDAKADSTKATELTAWIKATDATLRRQQHDLDAILKDLGTRVLAANLAEHRLAGFYRQRNEIQRQVDEHSANIARLEQEQVGHKASLGFNVRKAVIIGGAAVVALVILIWIVTESM
jgi:uncharacterized protein YijF (DUF1287 family)